MSLEDPIYFTSIPGPDGHSQTFLSIYPPGTWMSNVDFYCFVGGGSVGHKATFAEAKKHLLQEAKKYCIREVEKAKKQAEHYQAELNKLSDKGLGRQLKKGERP